MYASGKFSADLLYRLSSGHEISRTNMYVRHAVGNDTTEIRNHSDYRSHTPATHDLRQFGIRVCLEKFQLPTLFNAHGQCLGLILEETICC